MLIRCAFICLWHCFYSSPAHCHDIQHTYTRQSEEIERKKNLDELNMLSTRASAEFVTLRSDSDARKKQLRVSFGATIGFEYGCVSQQIG